MPMAFVDTACADKEICSQSERCHLVLAVAVVEVQKKMILLIAVEKRIFRLVYVSGCNAECKLYH